MDADGDKSQEATQHRRQQAREEGQVPRSQDLGSAVLLVGGLWVLFSLSGGLVTYFADYAQRQFGGAAWLTADSGFVHETWMGELNPLARAILPLLAAGMVIGIVTSLFQGGILFLPDKLMPDFSRVDPLQGFRRLFSMASVVRLVFGIFKIIIVAAVAYWSLQGRYEDLLLMAFLTLPQIGALLFDILFWTSMKIGAALLMLAVADYAYQYWKYEQDLMMTTQEVREEMKNLQGDPQILSRRRAAQRQLVLNRLSKTVPKADVVVTNPTELAVALRYDDQTMLAPVVVAKGAGILAQRIRKLALEHGIPIIEKKPLAQALYKDVEVNHPIPDKLYAAVAEILAYVYQLKGKPLPKAPTPQS
ncbi:MAG: flagellar biosynthesis protein FlhB [Planctomycetia bacterium]|nr:flagellar biosynthesis protein FlhB [Planctomycetia bacterium]